MQHQPRMPTNASFSKQQILICIGTVSSQEVILRRTMTLPTRSPMMTCETKWMILWSRDIDLGYTIVTGNGVRPESGGSLHT